MIKFTATKEEILKAAAANGTARGALAELFPGAFKEDWEEVPLSDFSVGSAIGGGYWFNILSSGENLSPFVISPSDLPSSKRFKIENGRIWRRTSK